MTTVTAHPESINIDSLLGRDKKPTQSYIIPLYQRNYSWKRQEIRQLLDDIHDKSKEESSIYYLGTLVVDISNEGELEVIDGQQRFTTLTIINAVLNYQLSGQDKNNNMPQINFEARDEVRKYLQLLYTNYKEARYFQTENLEVVNFIEAVKYVEEFLHTLPDQEALRNFANYFYDKVKIIRINVPPGTDINHYFEIMNNRGEQLEKHEILKATFISKLPKEHPDLNKRFADIWDACSQMDRHVVSAISLDLRREICGNDFNEIPTNYLKEESFVSNESGYNGDTAVTLRLILEYDTNVRENTTKNENSNKSRFKSIIDFPNFLLQVLKLDFVEDISLDDKKLLDEFGYTNKNGRTLPDPIKFINTLLYYRLIFDRFIIKREEANDDWNWKILKPNITSGKELSLVETFPCLTSSYVDDEVGNKEVVMLQSMFHVSFPGNNYKEWLFNLMQLFKTAGASIEPLVLKEALLKLARLQLKKSFDFNWFRSVMTPRFVFNYLDYLIWNIKDSHKLSITGKAKFENFKFSQNNSVEHMHPQSKAEELNISPQDEAFDSFKKKKVVDYFGNLCLISQGSNSKYNDYNFGAKKEQFEKRSSVESLKQVLMFEEEKWGIDEIIKHGKNMIELLNKAK